MILLESCPSVGQTPFQANLNYYDPASDPLFAYDYGLNSQSSVNLDLFVDDLDESKFELNELNLLNGSVAQEFEGYIFKKTTFNRFKCYQAQQYLKQALSRLN